MDSPRVDLKPLFAVLTLAIGIAFAATVDAVSKFLFSKELAQEASVETAVLHDSFAAPAMESPAPRSPTTFSCYDLNILPIWHELKRGPEFKDWSTNTTFGHLDCSEVLDIKQVDLNRDGSNEFLVRGKGFPLCGATGNCNFWVFEKNRHGFTELLASSDYIDVSELGEQVRKDRTRGYSNLLLRGHFSVSETSYSTYTFDGERYVESRCMFEVPKADRTREGGWEMITCKEFLNGRRF